MPTRIIRQSTVCARKSEVVKLSIGELNARVTLIALRDFMEEHPTTKLGSSELRIATRVTIEA